MSSGGCGRERWAWVWACTMAAVAGVSLGFATNIWIGLAAGFSVLLSVWLLLPCGDGPDWEYPHERKKPPP